MVTSAIKSAIMTTGKILLHINLCFVPAWEMKGSRNTGAEFKFGSGHVNPIKTVDLALVYEIIEDDYLNMLCYLNYTSFVSQSLS